MSVIGIVDNVTKFWIYFSAIRLGYLVVAS